MFHLSVQAIIVQMSLEFRERSVASGRYLNCLGRGRRHFSPFASHHSTRMRTNGMLSSAIRSELRYNCLAGSLAHDDCPAKVVIATQRCSKGRITLYHFESNLIPPD